MNPLTLFLLAVSLSMDAFAVSVCGGLKMSGKERLRGGLVCGAWFGAFQALMPYVGYELGSHFAKAAAAYSHWVIFVILAYIGWNMIKESGEDQEQEKITGVKTMLGLAVATSLDAGRGCGLCLYGHCHHSHGAGNRYHHVLFFLHWLHLRFGDRNAGQGKGRTDRRAGIDPDRFEGSAGTLWIFRVI